MKKVPPAPPQKLLHNNFLNKIVSLQIDSRREVKPRFCCRERVGTTKTPRAKKVVLLWRDHRDIQSQQ